MLYNKFTYIYPPRPEVKTSPNELDRYDNGQYVGQPKYNGTCVVVFTNGVDLHIYNRHKQTFPANTKHIDFLSLAKTKNWYVYAGEYLNKGKLGESGIKEKDLFIIWDCLVWDGERLVGKTLEYRLNLLEQIYPCKRAVVGSDGIEMYNHLCCTEFKGIYKAPTYLGGFSELYKDIVKTDLYEGLVLKKRDSKLGFGFQSANNQEWQIKCRKENKLYHF